MNMKRLITMMIVLTISCNLSNSISRPDSHVERPKTQPLYEVEITAYHPVKEQCSGNPLITADRSEINLKNFPKNWIAVSRDFLNERGYKYGDRVYINVTEGNLVSGVYEIHDTMHARWSNRVDILLPPGAKADKWKGTIRRV